MPIGTPERTRRTTVRELRPQREPARAWPAAILAGVVLTVVGLMTWAALSPTFGRSERPSPAAAVAIIAGLLLAGGVGSWALTAAPRRLDYRLRGRTLVVTTLLGKRLVPLSKVAGAEAVPFTLATTPGAHAGLLNSHMPGYYVGVFPLSGLGRTRVVVGVRRGRGVLLRLQGGEALLLAPQDPDALVALAAQRGGRT